MGPCGMGDRKDLEFVLEDGFCIFNRHMDMSHVNDTSTCSRTSDGPLVQIDFCSWCFAISFGWCGWWEFGLPIDLDHRCVHCKVRCFAGTREIFKKHPCLKGWKPHFDDDKLPTKFHNAVSAARTCCHDLTFASLEHVVRNCAVDGEQTQRDRVQNFSKA